jgi:aminopeptidase YwaD
MIAMATEIIRDGLVYHTLKDTIDQVEPEAVQTCLRVIHEFIQQKEQQTGI